MTAPGRPRSIAISKASRSDSRIAAGSMRASSTTRSVSWALRAKCLMVEMRPRLCAPAIMLPAISPVSSGSSEKYSKLRPPRGSRMRLAVPPRRTLKPFRARFSGHCLALKPREAHVPGRGEGEIGRHRRRRVAGADVARVGDAELGVRLLQGGNSEARDARHVACRPDRSGRFGLVAPGRSDHAMDQRQLLLIGHLLERHPRALGRRQRRIAPRPVLGPGRRRDGRAHKEDHKLQHAGQNRVRSARPVQATLRRRRSGAARSSQHRRNLVESKNHAGRMMAAA